MPTLQLELNLWQQLAEAQRSPETIDWQQLCLTFDATITRTPVGQQLAIAGEVLVEMAEVLAARAEQIWQDWRRDEGDDPIFNEEDLEEFVVQGAGINFSDLLKEYSRNVRSNVSVISKEEALKFAHEPEPETLSGLAEGAGAEAIESLEYDEDIAAWAEAVRGWMRDRAVTEVEFLELLDGVGLSIVKVWLALLLGGFELRQSGGFYDGAGMAIALASNGVEA